MKKVSNLLLLSSLAIFSACNMPVNPDLKCFGTDTKINTGETAFYKTCPSNESKPELTVKFSEVVSDSRCLVNAVCIWEGEAIVELNLDKGKEKIKLSTREPKSAAYNGHTVSLVSLTKPSEGEKNYTATILVK